MHKLHLLLHRLADAGVEFVVIGGYAGVIHGSALVTYDVDVCAVLSPENVERIRTAFPDLNPVHRQTRRKLSFKDHPQAGQAVLDLCLETEFGIIDVFSTVLGIGDFERLKAKAEKVTIFSKTCHVIALEDLIAAKLAVGREKDHLAAKELRAILAKRNEGASE